MPNRFAVAGFIIVLVLIAATGWAQVSTSSITGQVTDSSGAVVVGAQVQVKNDATGAVYQGVTTPTGNYVFPSLRPALTPSLSPMRGSKPSRAKTTR